MSHVSSFATQHIQVRHEVLAATNFFQQEHDTLCATHPTHSEFTVRT